MTPLPDDSIIPEQFDTVKPPQMIGLSMGGVSDAERQRLFKLIRRAQEGDMTLVGGKGVARTGWDKTRLARFIRRRRQDLDGAEVGIIRRAAAWLKRRGSPPTVSAPMISEVVAAAFERYLPGWSFEVLSYAAKGYPDGKKGARATRDNIQEHLSHIAPWSQRHYASSGTAFSWNPAKLPEALQSLSDRKLVETVVRELPDGPIVDPEVLYADFGWTGWVKEDVNERIVRGALQREVTKTWHYDGHKNVYATWCRWRITNPQGQSAELDCPVYKGEENADGDTSYPVSASQWKSVYTALGFGAAVTAGISLAEAELAALPAPGAGNRGAICPVCFGRWALVGEGLSHHLYSRPGWGYVVNPCDGSRYLPWQESSAGTENARRLRQQTSAYFKRQLAELLHKGPSQEFSVKVTVRDAKGEPVPEKDPDRRRLFGSNTVRVETVRHGHPWWQDLFERHRYMYSSSAAAYQDEAEIYLHLVNTWPEQHGGPPTDTKATDAEIQQVDREIQELNREQEVPTPFEPKNLSPLNLVWSGEDDENGWFGEDEKHMRFTVARVQYAKEGEADGSLAVFATLLAGGPVKKPSPAGWYWLGTTERRGWWERPVGPFDTSREALLDADKNFGEEWNERMMSS